MASTIVPIEGTFDIARGRNVLRTHIAACKWSPMFGARASALLTALGELILYAGMGQLVIVKLHVIEEGKEAGVELACKLNLPKDAQGQFEKARERLHRAADSLDIEETDSGVNLRACVRVS